MMELPVARKGAQLSRMRQPEQPDGIFRVPELVPILGFLSSSGLLVFELVRRFGAFTG